MYGHIHIILKDLVDTVAGSSKWRQILKEAGLDKPEAEARILDTVVQDDDVTYGLVGATCKVLGLTAEQALTTFGRHFVTFALRSGNACFLKAQGTTLPKFLANINHLHNHLERDHPNARFPFVEAKYDPVKDEVLLTYLSTRENLAPLVVGVIEEIGKRLYGLDVEMTPTDVPEDLHEAYTLGRAAAWITRWRPRPGGPEIMEPAKAQTKMSFASLHSAMMDFGRLVRNTKTWMPHCACSISTVASDAIELCLDDERNRDELPMRRSVSSVRKQTELEVSGVLPQHVLMRGVKARQVAAAWSDATLLLCRPFWQSADGRSEDFELSQDLKRVDIFVSHSWSPPENWELIMGSDVRHADVKSTTLAIMAKDIALARGELDSWGEITFWVDKACIPQDSPKLKELCIGLIEHFVSRCDYICVIFTWSYLERLWCVFEWACFLVDKEPSEVHLQNEFFVKEDTLPLYLDNVRYFSLRRAKCFHESDRAILEKKISDCYVSHQAFEELVQATVVALMARSMAYRGGRSVYLRNTFYQPWVDLAGELGFKDLQVALQGCRPLEWRSEAAISTRSPTGAVRTMPVLLGQAAMQMGVSASKYHSRINQWFDRDVSPILREIRGRVVCR